MLSDKFEKEMESITETKKALLYINHMANTLIEKMIHHDEIDDLVKKSTNNELNTKEMMNIIDDTTARSIQVLKLVIETYEATITAEHQEELEGEEKCTD